MTVALRMFAWPRRTLWCALAVLFWSAAAPYAPAGVSYELGNAAPFCKEFRLGRWTFDDVTLGSLSGKTLFFSWKDNERTELLVRLTHFGTLKNAANEVYLLDLASGRVRRSTAEEWSRGIAIEPFGCYGSGDPCGEEWLSATMRGPLVVDGRELPKAGEYWAGPVTSAAPPSPGRRWILLHSYSGNVKNWMSRWGAEYGHVIRGTGYIQLLRMKDAKELFRIRVQVRNEYPDQITTDNPWLDDDLLVISIFRDHRRLLICRID